MNILTAEEVMHVCRPAISRLPDEMKGRKTEIAYLKLKALERLLRHRVGMRWGFDRAADFHGGPGYLKSMIEQLGKAQ